jgi:hypothetical protein
MCKFSLSKESINRLKSLSAVSQTIILKREMFFKDVSSSMMVKSIIKDIPDDFNMPVYDLTTFLGTYCFFDNATIDYSNSNKEYIEIINTNNAKDKFVFRFGDKQFVRNDMNIDLEKGLKEKYKEHNSFDISTDDVNKILKSGKLVNSDLIKFYASENTQKIKLYDSSIPNSNIYEIDVDNAIIKFNKMEFNMTYSLFTLVDKSVKKYNIKYCKSDSEINAKTLIMDTDDDLTYYFARVMKKGVGNANR